MFFNNIDFSEYLIINKVKNSILPPIQREFREKPRSRGQKPISKKLGMRIIEVDITLRKFALKHYNNHIRELADLLYTEDDKKLIFKNEPDKYYIASLGDGTDIVEGQVFGESTITFICPDPIAFGLNRSIPITDNATLYLQCTYETLPKFYFNISFDINKIKINNTTTGQYVEINHDFIIGDKVEIDFSDKWKVRKNGIVIAEDVTIESDFFSLNVGENKISANIPCTLEYIERWL